MSSKAQRIKAFPEPLRRPSFVRHLALLWGLRLTLALNRGGTRGRIVAIAAYVVSTLPGWVLGAGAYGIMTWGPVVESPLYAHFFLNLLCFVTAAVWTTWPILSASVDDHSELARFHAFPISGLRLLVASMAATQFEPRALVIYAPLAGAALGFATVHPLASNTAGIGLFMLYVALNAAWGRVGLHAVLGVLRQQKSAQAIGGFFIVVLLACTLIPPIDTSWLFALGQQGVNALGADIIERAALAFSRVPPGFLGAGLAELAIGNTFHAGLFALGLTFFAASGFVVAWLLLLRLQQPARRGAGPLRKGRDGDRIGTAPTRFDALVRREAFDLWRNPRARLLASVPFLLAILLKLLSGRGLFVFLAGESADAWLIGGLCLYGAIVIASTFSQNMFGYDGHGLRALLAAPIDPTDVIRAKNLVHGGAALLLATAVGIFYRLYFGFGTIVDLGIAFAAVLTALPVLLAAGNFLSVLFPVKFHVDLQRRDRLPFAASMLGVAAASIGTAPFAILLRRSGLEGPTPTTALTLLGLSGLAWGVYALLLPLSLALFARQRERVLHAVTRE